MEGRLGAPLTICIPYEELLENIRSSLSRPGLHTFGDFKAHSRKLAIAAGGPSLEDTWKRLDGDVAAVNGSLRFLRERDITPWACGVLDPRPRMADVVDAVPGIFYFVSSTVHPTVFDKLQRAGCDIVLWHPSPWPTEFPEPALLVGGGTTMGLRWINLGYCLGYRRFDLHGLDSSYRDDKTHAYPDGFDRDIVEVSGYRTSPNFMVQVLDYFELMKLYDKPEVDPVVMKVYGDGLLQHECKRMVEAAKRGEAYHPCGAGDARAP